MNSAVPLTQAVTSGDANAVRAAIASGADVNQRNNGGQTVLILAVIFSHTEIVRLLVKAGADPRLRDNLGLDAVEWAQRRGLNDIVDLFTNNTSVPEPRIETDEKSRKWLEGVKQRIQEEADAEPRIAVVPERRVIAAAAEDVAEEPAVVPIRDVMPVLPSGHSSLEARRGHHDESGRPTSTL